MELSQTWKGLLPHSDLVLFFSVALCTPGFLIPNELTDKAKTPPDRFSSYVDNRSDANWKFVEKVVELILSA